MNFLGLSKNLRHRITYSSSSHVDPVDTQLPCVNFTFFCKPVIRQWLYNSPGQRPEFLSDCYAPVTVISFAIFPQPLITGEAIRRELRDQFPPVYERSLEEMIKNVAQTTQGLMESAVQGHNVFNVNVQVVLTYNRVVVPEEVIIRHFMEVTMDDFSRMVPATDESIKLLQYKTITDSGENNCVVCLEELSAGCEAAYMPCSHAFHGDCIEKWLRTSHYCPICRLQMPTATS